METKELALKIKESICQWARLNILLLACMILIRIAFLAATYFRIDIESSKCAIILSGCIFDLITISHIIAYGLVPFIILHHFLPKTSRVICMILISIYCIFSLLLTEYFCNTTMPLDHVVFAYSPEEIQGIIKTSVSIGVPTIACFVIPAIAITILMFVWKKVKFNIIISGAIIIASVATAIAINYTKTIEYEKLYSNHKDFCLATNQPSFSIIKIATHIKDFQSESSLETIKTASAEYQNLFPDKEFVNDGYPLYHKNKYNDVLGNFISKTSDGNYPNFVFIIVESLGQRLTGVQNESISFTPFIDSLKHEGLYWNNCLAASERTFGVLPAIFASAPYGQYGFVQIWDPMPNHNSLLKDMTANGYQSSYFYGGVHEFDRYDIFLKTNNVEYIYVPKIDDIDSSIYKTLNDYHRWGIDDKNLVENAIKYKKNNPSTQPYIDIYMTLSTHEPFIFDDIETYKAKVKEKVGKQNISNKEEKNNILNNLDIFACFAYTDDCIKELMDYYKTLPEYENTIFVITGDHRMGMLTLPLGVTLSACNVPLIIYSPLIKTPREMKAVVAHEDITPSLNAYLSHNYEYTTSDYCHWIGNELDTAKEYRCNKKIAFMKNNRDVVDYLNGDYYISRGKILSVGKDFDLSIITDDDKYSTYAEQLNNFNIISQYTVKHNRLKPLENIEVLYEHFFDFDMVADNTLIEHMITNNIFIGYISDDENKHIHIDGKVEFAPICPTLTINNEYRAINNDIEFDIKNNDTKLELPELVISMDGYYMSVQLVSENGESLNTGNTEHFRTRLTIPAGKNNKGKTIKYYLFNKHKASVDYDNIFIMITAEK